MRNALATTLYELAKQDDRIVVIVADISPAGAMDDFRREFPTRFINTGVAEQAAVGLAAGLAQRGFRPFVYTIATFSLFRPYEFVRCDLAYQNLPVTVVGMGAGLSYPTLGATHQAVEDVAVAMACPNLTVLVPCDPVETAECVRWCAGRESGGPVYLRLGKAGEPNLSHNQPKGAPIFDVESSLWLHKIDYPKCAGTCFVTYGPIAKEVAAAAAALDADAIAVRTLAPLHSNLIRGVAGRYANIVVVEEAVGAPLGVLFSAELSVDRVASLSLPREFCRLHGTREELLAYYGLTAEKIVEQVRQS